jgi:molybdopterin converting factor small subunit
MRVTVQYMAQLKRLAGCSRETLELAGPSTLGDLLNALAGPPYSPDFRAQVSQRSLLFFVGDEPAARERVLHDGDCVTILTPMAGG